MPVRVCVVDVVVAARAATVGVAVRWDGAFAARAERVDVDVCTVPRCAAVCMALRAAVVVAAREVVVCVAPRCVTFCAFGTNAVRTARSVFTVVDMRCCVLPAEFWRATVLPSRMAAFAPPMQRPKIKVKFRIFFISDKILAKLRILGQAKSKCHDTCGQ